MKINFKLLSSIVVIIALFVIVLSLLFFKKTAEEENLENQSFYQYLSGIKFEYSGNLRITKGGNITELIFDEVKVVLDSTPLYYKDEKKILLPQNMSIVYPLSNSTQFKTNFFSRVYIEDNTIYLQDGRLNKVLSNCFLYDGKDLFFFIEETKILIDEEEITIQPLSYAVLTYNDNIQIYSYDIDQFKTIVIKEKKDILATAKGYTVNLSIDSVEYNTKSRLLIKNMGYLKNIE